MTEGASVDIVSSGITVSTGSVSEPAGKNVDVRITGRNMGKGGDRSDGSRRVSWTDQRSFSIITDAADAAENEERKLLRKSGGMTHETRYWDRTPY